MLWLPARLLYSLHGFSCYRYLCYFSYILVVRPFCFFFCAFFFYQAHVLDANRRGVMPLCTRLRRHQMVGHLSSHCNIWLDTLYWDCQRRGQQFDNVIYNYTIPMIVSSTITFEIINYSSRGANNYGLVDQINHNLTTIRYL